ncbi:MAG: DeoR family transcriptional regulator [Alphaproteobacteria bacterium]
MIPAQRQKKILEILSHDEMMSYANLAKKLDVSHMTIRRDIIELEKLGKVSSVSGGVVLPLHINDEPPYKDKLNANIQQKETVSYLAVQQIPQESRVIYLDAGTTCLAIAHKLASRKDLTFLTNDLGTADFLIEHSASQVIFIGGEICKENKSSVGEIAANLIRQVNIDLAFISTSSWDQKGLSTPDARKLAVKKAVVESSEVNILVSDASKYGKKAPFHIFPLSVFNQIICDEKLPPIVVSEIKKHNIDVLIASDKTL